MNDFSQNPSNQEMSVGNWVVTLIVTAIPLIGFIMLFVWAFGSNTPVSKANWAKAALIIFAVGIALSILLSLVFGVGILSLMNNNNAGNY